MRSPAGQLRVRSAALQLVQLHGGDQRARHLRLPGLPVTGQLALTSSLLPFGSGAGWNTLRISSHSDTKPSER